MKNWSIRQKLLLSLSGAVLVATLLISLIGQSMTERLLTERTLQSELPTILSQIKQTIETEIKTLSQVAEQFATSPTLHQLSAQGRVPELEAQLVLELEKARQAHGLQAASFCDRTTGDYWNESGFLRRLTPELDGWFFDFKPSGKSRQVSIYKDPVLGYQIFVNYQQVDGRGLSGIAKPMTSMVEMISQFKIEDSGFVFLADKAGQIQLHPTLSIGTSLASEYPGLSLESLLTPGGVKHTLVEVDGKSLVFAATYIEALDWYLMAQVPEEEIFSLMKQIKVANFLIAALVTLLIAIISLFISRSITAPIQRLGQVFTQLGQAEADLSVRLEQQGGQELVSLTQGFNQFVGNINQLVTDIQKSTQQLAQQSRELNLAAQQSLEHNQQQLTASSKVEDAIHQMSSTVAEIAQNTSLSAESTTQAGHSVLSGQQQVALSLQGIKQLAGHVDTAQTEIRELANKAGSIRQIVEVIQSIAEQTNLLALNAAIEAARAGEHGRGFAVVADEVRQLAARTQGSTKAIQQVVTDLLTQTERAVEATAAASGQALENLNRSDAVETSLTQITSEIQQLEGMSIQIAAATEEQATVVDEVGGQMQTMHQISETNLKNAGVLSDFANQLGALASELERLTGRFSA